MQNKLVQKIPGFVKFDQFLLLNFPRLWLSRAHVVVATASIIYAVLLLLTLGVIRPALVPSYSAVLSGPDYGCLGKPTAVEQIECAIPAAYQELSSTISTSVTLMDVITSIVAVLLMLLWMRAQSRYSVEEMHGQSHWYSAWLEWACYALCIGLIFGAGWIVRIGLSPSPAHMQAFNSLPVTPYNGIGDYRMPRDLHITIRAAPTPTGSSYVNRWVMDVAPNSPESKHLQQIADGAYAQALGAKVSRPDTAYEYNDTPETLQFLPWLLIVGYGAYMIYVSKRQRWVHIFTAFLFSNILVFVAFFLAVFIFGIIFSSMGGRAGEYIMLGLLVGGLTLGLVVTGIQWIRALTIQRFSLSAALGTIALPWVLAYTPIILLAVSSEPRVQSWLGWEWKSRQQSEAIAIAVALAPFLFLPIMPLLDKALVRLGALPTER